MTSSFASQLAIRFAPFDFSNVHGFPNYFPDRDEWEDHLLVFREDDEDHFAYHLIDFHECVDQ